MLKKIYSTSEDIKQANQVSELKGEIAKENYKYVKLTGISNVINSLHSTDFSNEPLMHDRMNRIPVSYTHLTLPTIYSV